MNVEARLQGLAAKWRESALFLASLNNDLPTTKQDIVRFRHCAEELEEILRAALHGSEAAPPAPTAEPPILENAPPSKLDKLVEEYRAADVPCHDAVCPECGHYFETNIPEVAPPAPTAEPDSQLVQTMSGEFKWMVEAPAPSYKAPAAPPERVSEGPIPLNDMQEKAAKLWATDDRLWTTQETVEFNLRTFARKILQLQDAAHPTVEPREEPR